MGHSAVWLSLLTWLALAAGPAGLAKLQGHSSPSMQNVCLASTAARRRQDSHVASCSPPHCREQFLTASAFHHSAVQRWEGADLHLSPYRAIQDRDKAVYEAEELKALSREQQRRLLVAETTAEQESTLRQGSQLGRAWRGPGVGGVDAHAGSWAAGS